MPKSRTSRSVSPQKSLNPEISAQLLEREKIFQNVQEMFCNTVDAEVIHMVLVECSWRGEEAIDKLLAIGENAEAQRQYKKKSQLQQIAEGVFGSLSSEDYQSHGPRRISSNPAIPTSPLSHIDKIIRRPVRATQDGLPTPGGSEQAQRTQSFSPGLLSPNLLSRGATADFSLSNSQPSKIEPSNKVVDEIEMDLHFPRLPSKSSGAAQSSESSSTNSQNPPSNPVQYNADETVRQSAVKPTLISEAQSAYNQQYDDAAGAQKWEECKNILSEHYVKSLSGNQSSGNENYEGKKHKSQNKNLGESGAVFCDDPAILRAHPERHQRSETSRSFPVRLLSKSPETTRRDMPKTSNAEGSQGVSSYSREFSRLDSADLDETVLKCISEVHDDLVDQKAFGESYPPDRPRSSSLPFSQGSERESDRTGSVTPDNSLRNTPIPNNQPMTLPVIGLSVEAAEFVPRPKPSKSEESTDLPVSKALPALPRSKSIEIKTGVKNVRISSPTVPAGSPKAISPIISPALSPSSPNLNNPVAVNLTGSPMFITPKWSPVFQQMTTPPPPLQPPLLPSAARYMHPPPPHIAPPTYRLPPGGPLPFSSRIVYSVAPPPIFRVAGTPQMQPLRPPPHSSMSNNLEDRAAIATGQPIMATSEASRLISPPIYSGLNAVKVVNRAAMEKYVQPVKLVNQVAIEQYVHRIKELHTCGRKVLVIIRGLPGSGKSTLSRGVQMDGLVLSTDDYFTRGDMYDYNPDKLPESHQWNRERAKEAMKMGTSPIVIDNTNTQRWEFKPYVSMAHNHNYHVEIMEPVTPWKFKPKELARLTLHGVPQDHIQRMLARYEPNITVDMVSNKKKYNNTNNTKLGIPSNVIEGEEVVPTSVELEAESTKTGITSKNTPDVLRASFSMNDICSTNELTGDLKSLESNPDPQAGWRGQTSSPRSVSSRASSSDRYTGQLSRASPISSQHSRSASPYIEEFLHSDVEKSSREPLEAASYISSQIVGLRKPIKQLESDSSESASTQDDASFHSCNSEVPSSQSSKDVSPKNVLGGVTPLGLHSRIGKSKSSNLASAFSVNVAVSAKQALMDRKREESIKETEAKLDSESLQIVEDLFDEHVKNKTLSEYDLNRIEEELKALVQLFFSDNDQIAAAEVLIALKLHKDIVDETEDSEVFGASNDDLKDENSANLGLDTVGSNVCDSTNRLDKTVTHESIRDSELDCTDSVEIELTSLSSDQDAVADKDQINEATCDTKVAETTSVHSESMMDTSELAEDKTESYSSKSAIESETARTICPETDINVFTCLYSQEMISNNSQEVLHTVAVEANHSENASSTPSDIEQQYWGKISEATSAVSVIELVKSTWDDDDDNFENWEEANGGVNVVDNTKENIVESKPQRRKRNKENGSKATNPLDIESENTVSSLGVQVTEIMKEDLVKNNEDVIKVESDALEAEVFEYRDNSGLSRDKTLENQNCESKNGTLCLKIEENGLDENHDVLHIDEMKSNVGSRQELVNKNIIVENTNNTNETLQLQSELEKGIVKQANVNPDPDLGDDSKSIEGADDYSKQNDEKTLQDVGVKGEDLKKTESDFLSKGEVNDVIKNDCMTEINSEDSLIKTGGNTEAVSVKSVETVENDCSQEVIHEHVENIHLNNSEIQDHVVKDNENSSLSLLKKAYSDSSIDETVNCAIIQDTQSPTTLIVETSQTSAEASVNKCSDINENELHQDSQLAENGNTQVTDNENQTQTKHSQEDTKESVDELSKKTFEGSAQSPKSGLEKRKKPSRRKMAAKFEGPLFNSDDKKKFLSGNWSSLPSVPDNEPREKPIDLSNEVSAVAEASPGGAVNGQEERECQTESSDFAALNNLSQGGFVDASLKYLTGRAKKYINMNDSKSKIENSSASISTLVAVLMIDKSTSTDDLELLSDSESVEFLKTCFPDVPEDELECVLINCADNVEWAINLLLDWKYSLYFSEEEKQKFVDGMAKVQRGASPESVENENQPSSLLDICFNLVERENIATREEIEEQLIQTGKERLDRIEIRLRRSTSLSESSFNCSDRINYSDISVFRSLSLPDHLPGSQTNSEILEFSITDGKTALNNDQVIEMELKSSVLSEENNQTEIDTKSNVVTENMVNSVSNGRQIPQELGNSDENGLGSIYNHSQHNKANEMTKEEVLDESVLLNYLEQKRIKAAEIDTMDEDDSTEELTVDDGEDLVEEGGAPALTMSLEADVVTKLERLYGVIADRQRDKDMVTVSLDHKTAWLLYQCVKQGLTDNQHRVKQQVLEDEEYARKLQIQFEHERKKNQSRLRNRVAGAWNRGVTPLVGMSVQGTIPQKRKMVQMKSVKPLTEIMQEEMQKQSTKQDFQKMVVSEGGHVAIATRMKRQKLFEKYPDIDRTLLDEIFEANCFNLTETEAAITSFLGENPPAREVMTEEAIRERDSRLMEITKQRSVQEMLDSYLYTPHVNKDYQDGSDPNYEDYRGEANLHHRLRHECFQKAQEAYRRGLKQVASFYSQQGHLHTQKIKESNMRASEQILSERNTELEKNMILDLHGLHVDEGIAALERVIPQKERERLRGLTIITGRGSHSRGGVARLRPSVLAFLQRHQYNFTETQTGVFRVSLKYRYPDR